MRDELKYIIFKEFNKIIIFSPIIEHKELKYIGKIKSAGFIAIGDSKCVCYGQSISLDVKSMKEDSDIATKHVFGE